MNESNWYNIQFGRIIETAISVLCLRCELSSKSHLSVYVIHNVRISNFTYKVLYRRNKSIMNLTRNQRIINESVAFGTFRITYNRTVAKSIFSRNSSAQSIPANATMATRRSPWSIAEETPRRAENLNVIWRGDRRVTRPGPRHRVVYHAPRRNVLPL